MTGEHSTTECRVAPIGSFVDPNTGRITPCPSGTYNDQPGATRCLPCPTGNFSYEGSSTCSSCPAVGAACVQGEIELLDGYWRADEPGSKITGATLFYLCPTPKTCFPESNLSGLVVRGASALRTNQTRCADGHTGPVCAICADGYGKSVWSEMCYSCGGRGFSGSSTALVTLTSMLVGVVVLLLGFGAYFASVCKDGEAGGDIPGSVTDFSAFKIMLSWIQVVSTLGKTFQVPWPEAFSQQVNALYSFANLEVFSFLGNAMCGLKMSAVEQLYLHLASLPVIILTIVLAMYVVGRGLGATEAQRRRMRCVFFV